MTTEELRDILGGAARTIAVVGLSPSPERPSNGVARYLREAGFRIVPVNPHHDTIRGQRSYPTRTAAAAALWPRTKTVENAASTSTTMGRTRVGCIASTKALVKT